MFPLSSWAARRQPITEWLIAELNQRSYVPKKVARRWVEAEQILPLLDGLDEVAAPHREACVKALNQFRREHGLLSIVICSRIADYEALGTTLRYVIISEVANRVVNEDSHDDSGGHQYVGRNQPRQQELIETKVADDLNREKGNGHEKRVSQAIYSHQEKVTAFPPASSSHCQLGFCSGLFPTSDVFACW